MRRCGTCKYWDYATKSANAFCLWMEQHPDFIDLDMKAKLPMTFQALPTTSRYQGQDCPAWEKREDG